MAELIGKSTENLIAFSLGIKNHQGGRELYEKYLSDIDTITPTQLFLVMNEQLKRGVSVDEMLGYVDKLINVFHQRLSDYPWEKPGEGTFLDYLMQENAGLIARLTAFKAVVKANDMRMTKAEIPALIEDLTQYHVHMQKLENILFPYLEKADARFLGLKALWALHDKARTELKMTYRLLEQSIVLDDRDFNVALGRLYFLLYGLVEKQELILFPAASEVLPKQAFEAMQAQSFEYGFAYITPPERKAKGGTVTAGKDMLDAFDTQTGSLSSLELSAVLNALPVDITLIDANDKVKFFSDPKARIFPRSPAIIGRDVRNCHPPKSVHMVERILNAFKAGEKDSARFWIQMGEKFVVIEYTALRDENGIYLGTLEVTQEASDIRALSGEKRLLD